VVPVPPFGTVKAEARVNAPLEEKEEVAVAPKYAGPYAEKSEVEAFPNCCKAVQIFAFPRLSPTVCAVLPL